MYYKVLKGVEMTTLRDVWTQKGMRSTQVAAASGISIGTLYRCNRKEDDVQFSTVVAVCKVLGLSLDEYAALDRCPRADQFKEKEQP
jgi:DNA-binding phage protein